MNRQDLVYGLLAGALGGAIGWLPAEFLAIWRPEETALRYLLLVLYFAVVGGSMGAVIGGLDGVRARQSERTRRGALIGAALGVIGGAIGSLPAEMVFATLNGWGFGLIGRAVGWAIVGAFIGVVQGVANRDRVRMIRGGLGGLLGGYLGGGAFELVSLAFAGGAGSRWIAVVLLGIFLGALIALIQGWLSDARLVVISSGAQEGNKLDLSKPVTVLGRGDRDDFVLYAGEGIQPGHAQVILKPNGYWMQPANPAYTVSINRQTIQGEQRLRPGDEIGIGSLILRFSEDTVNCPACGEPNAARSRFCRACGQSL